MFKVRVEAQETYRSSIRPAIMSSIRQVMENLNVNKDVYTFFNGESEVSRMIGTNFTENVRTDQPTDIGFIDRQFVTCDIVEAGVNDELDSKHIHVTNTPFWSDSQTQAKIIPMFVCRKVNLSVNRYFKDRVTANQFRDRVQNTLVNGFVNVFSPTVHYPLSYQIMSCYETIYHRLVNAGIVNGEEVTAYQWFTANCNVPYDVITDMAGKTYCFVFKRRIDTLSLLFNGVNITTTTKGRYQGQYLVSFDYSFYFADHTFFELHYPIMVYQQMTPKKYIPRIPNLLLNDYANSQFYESALSVGLGEYMEYKSPYMFVFPKEDNFRPHRIPYLDVALQRLAVVEDIENQVVINLFHFSELKTFWNPIVEKFIKRYHAHVTIRRKFPFHLKVFSDDIEVLEEHISLMENGDVILKHRPTMKAAYRIFLYFDRAIWDYDDDAWDKIRWDCELGKWVFDNLFPWLPAPTDRPCPIDDNKPWIDKEEIIPHVPYYPPSDDKIKLYMSDALLIAKNEQYPNEHNVHSYLFLKEEK